LSARSLARMIKIVRISQSLPLATNKLTPLELEQNITLDDAAALNAVHPVTFKRAFPHLVRKIGPRRQVVKLRDAINPTPPSQSE
jgi:hypothetical protein